MKAKAQTARFSTLRERLVLLATLVLIVVVFSSINPNFFSIKIFENILVSASLVGLVAIGETYLIIAGLVDLSPGSVVAFSSVIAGLFLQWGVPVPLVLPLVVVVGLFIGLLNALGVNKLNLEPFISTLVSMSVFRGLAYILCGGRPVFISNRSFTNMGSMRIGGVVGIPVLIMIVAFIVFGIILARTRFGRSIYVMGGNKYAAKLAGLNPARIPMILFMISAALSAVGCVLLAARMQSSQPSSATGLEFEAITAAVLGGTAFAGGVGTIGGTVLGVFILQAFNTGLIMSGVQIFWQQVARGLLLLIALAFDYYRRRQHEKRLILQSMALRGID